MKLGSCYNIRKGYKAPTIQEQLMLEGIPCMHDNDFCSASSLVGGIHGQPGFGWPSSITAEVKGIVEQQM